MSSSNLYHQQQQEFIPQRATAGEESGPLASIASSQGTSEATLTYSALADTAETSRLNLSSAYSSLPVNHFSHSFTAGTQPSLWGLTRQYSIPNSTQLYHVTAGRSISLPNVQRNQAYINITNPFQFSESSSSSNTASIPLYQSDSSIMSQERGNHTLHRGASADSSKGFQCPNCSKIFARGKF